MIKAAARPLRLTHVLASSATAFKGAKPGIFSSWKTAVLPAASHTNVCCTMTSTQLLSGTHDRYDGILIDGDDLPSDPNVFSTRLAESLIEWRRQQRKGIWLKLPVSKAGLLLEPALQQGFTFHHAEASYIQLSRWLPTSENKLPANASHQANLS
jgi:hypothetical protein